MAEINKHCNNEEKISIQSECSHKSFQIPEFAAGSDLKIYVRNKTNFCPTCLEKNIISQSKAVQLIQDSNAQNSIDLPIQLSALGGLLFVLFHPDKTCVITNWLRVHGISKLLPVLELMPEIAALLAEFNGFTINFAGFMLPPVGKDVISKASPEFTKFIEKVKTDAKIDSIWGISNLIKQLALPVMCALEEAKRVELFQFDFAILSSPQSEIGQEIQIRLISLEFDVCIISDINDVRKAACIIVILEPDCIPFLSILEERLTSQIIIPVFCKGCEADTIDLSKTSEESSPLQWIYGTAGIDYRYMKRPNELESDVSYCDRVMEFIERLSQNSGKKKKSRILKKKI